jgi:hypothetical protein
MDTAYTMGLNVFIFVLGMITGAIVIRLTTSNPVSKSAISHCQELCSSNGGIDTICSNSHSCTCSNGAQFKSIFIGE